jgi:hypothetical protein
MRRGKTKRKYKKSLINKKSRRNVKKTCGGKIRELPPPQPPISLPKVPPFAPPLSNTRGKKTKRIQKGGFKADEVDILEDRDDDWIITKQ